MRFSDFITLQRGFDLPKTEMQEGPFPVLGSTSVIGRHSEFKVEPPGVVTGRSGSLGVVQFVDERYWPHNTALWVKDFKGNDPRFVYYCMHGMDFARFNAGAGVPTLNRNHLDSLEVNVPPLPIQRQIAGILSGYDELIENSQRRIKILESMARALYREWFVHFRFPGHDSVPRVPSPLGEIPKNWEETDLAKVCADDKGIQTGPFGSQLHESDYSDEGVPVVMPKDIIDFHIRTDSIARIPEETADKLSRHRMQPGDIVYGRRGDIGRRAYLMRHQAGWFCGTGCLRIRPNPQAVNGWYLFNYLGQDDVVGLIRGRAQGVTMPNLNTGILSSVPVRLPPRKLQENFARLTFPMAEAHEVLTAKIENLRCTRDLLLPRMLSGKIDLEAINP